MNANEGAVWAYAQAHGLKVDSKGEPPNRTVSTKGKKDEGFLALSWREADDALLVTTPATDDAPGEAVVFRGTRGIEHLTSLTNGLVRDGARYARGEAVAPAAGADDPVDGGTDGEAE